ncbi:ribose ABC transporter substrate-binding protein RbsB [Pontibacillus yanchengensis]|uniref:Ribose ABC transporter substrate-binding protein RbsB n=2 Tax=Pontibacillus yanchengensis TaxID=462910 RepID=A0ACC7VL23_9BACI|nr:ribose ABC transporter substrate-binding protein RbsB [Pontibacillus yanchengensis]MYL35264.1 ribose ABC transporter substrate-binding protein RbsB [Pontibacillus yanchengensis]MYL54874.1 ribose ABC transporter substrate-binding protein RbsB [Pontibacillus yanchengensis]
MKHIWKSLGVALIALVFIAGCSTEAPNSSSDEGNGSGGDSEKEDGTLKIGLSISTQNNPFFVTLKEGAEKAAEEEGVELTTVDAQNDPGKQVSGIEDLITQNVDVLLVNPTDSAAITTAIESANEADIPVITVDRSADGGEVVSHIASDNVKGGEMAANYIVEQLSGGGKVVELEGIPGSSAARERGKGFHNVVDENDKIEVAAKQAADFDRSKGLTVMENIIQSTDNFDAVFAHNDEMALGAVQALESANMAEDTIVVGFDATDDARKAIEEGRMDATIAQQPTLIGEKAVQTAVKVHNGESVKDFIPVELKLVK